MVRSFFDPALITEDMPRLMPQSVLANPVPFDAGVLMDTARKNLQAMNEAGQLAIEGFQRVFEYQTQIASRMIEDQTALAREILVSGTPEQKVQRQADIMRLAYEHGVKAAKEMSVILTKSNDEAAHVINHRVSASLSEFKAAFDAKSKDDDE